MEKIFKQGQRVMVYDSHLFKDDKLTPCIDLMLPATVVCWYGKPTTRYSDDLTLGPYPSLVDVIFDHRPERVSHGHGGDSIETLEYLLDKDNAKRYKPEYLPKLIEKTTLLIGGCNGPVQTHTHA